jgi:hypothetical protein
MSKIFNISPHRSGTQSFTKFCTDHNLSAVHWIGDDFDLIAENIDNSYSLYNKVKHIINEYDIFSDLPWPILYQHILNDNIDCKFVFIKRNKFNWLKSIRKHTMNRNLSYQEKLFYKEFCGYKSETLDYSDELLLVSYQHFIDYAKSILDDKLSIFELEDIELSIKLANFLGFNLKHNFDHLT